MAVDGERLDFPRLHGAWNDKLVAEAAAGVDQLLWQKQPAPSDPSWCATAGAFLARLPVLSTQALSGSTAAQVACAHPLLLLPERDDPGAPGEPAAHGLALARRHARARGGPLLQGARPLTALLTTCMRGMLCLTEGRNPDGWASPGARRRSTSTASCARTTPPRLRASSGRGASRCTWRTRPPGSRCWTPRTRRA